MESNEILETRREVGLKLCQQIRRSNYKLIKAKIFRDCDQKKIKKCAPEVLANNAAG